MPRYYVMLGSIHNFNVWGTRFRIFVNNKLKPPMDFVGVYMGIVAIITCCRYFEGIC